MIRAAVLAIALGACSPAEVSEVDAPSVPPDRHGAGPIELETRSEYSQLRVRKRGRVRTLLFVDGGGRERVQSRVDLANPARLELPYTRWMFAGYLLQPAPRRALIVGLGGGAMTHHLLARDPAVEIDAVEIDREVIRVAAQLFDVREGPRLHVHHRDSIAWIRADGPAYDMIMLDAFLGGGDATDATGAPRSMRAASFLERVRARLSSDGVAVFNLHHHLDHDADLAAIRAAFPQVYTFLVPGDGNVIAVATMARERRDQDDLRQRASLSP